ncbi:MAG: diacylglycerol kinase family protein [Ilumatobacteraceae bacterium]
MRIRAVVPVAVAAGATAAGALWIRRIVLPPRPADVATPRSRPIPDPDSRPSPDGAGLRLAVNPTSGPAWSANPVDELRRDLPAADVRELGPDDDLVAVLTEPPLDGVVAIGAAGGDGTLSAAATVAHDHDLVLVAVPSGTLNHLARDLGLDETADAVAAVRAGTVTHMDLGSVDDEHGVPLRRFVNTLSFGGYTAVVDARDAMAPRLGKWLALAVALARELPRMEPLDLELDGRRTVVWVGWIGNGTYAPEGFGPSWRERLDDGELDVRLVLGGPRLARTRFVLDVLAGRLLHCPLYREYRLSAVTIRSHGGPVRLAVDGETFDGPASFDVTKIRRGLAVAVPPAG